MAVVSVLHELSTHIDNNSWKSLYSAAILRNFQPILQLANETADGLPTGSVYYHRTCRSDFTHKKSLAKFQKQYKCSSVIESNNPRRSSRKDYLSSESRLFDKKCIFCQRVTKYLKGTHTREALHRAVELRADRKIRKVATLHQDERILAITARDIVAAKAHFHKSCSRDYTRPVKKTDTQEFLQRN